MTIKDLCGVHYLSCVEAYFGAWIKDYFDLSALYCESFITWSEIVRAFSSGVKYSDFSLIPRLQELAENAGITTHEKRAGMPIGLDKKALTLLSVNETFFSERRPWRNDHYIAAERLTKKNILYLNEYPLEKAEMPLSEFYPKYGGVYLEYRLQGQENGLLQKKSELQREKLKNISKEDVPIIVPLVLRDALAIFRVSRKRTLFWLERGCPEKAIKTKELLKSQMETADRDYVQTQMGIMRNKNDMALVNSILEKFQITDLELSRAAQEEL